MTLHPLAEQFARVADAYERGRPDYGPEVVGELAAQFDLGPGATVLDLAAGTGKLTRALTAAKLDVIAVEPHAALREKLAAVAPTARVMPGLAEEIPLPDRSVDAVTVADAFHWFDQAGALVEIRRALRPRGGLALIRTFPDWSGASWAHEVGTLVNELRPEHPGFDGPPWQDAIRAADGWEAPREATVTVSQPVDAERIADYVTSMSFVARLPPDERDGVRSKVERLVAAGETPAELPVHFQIISSRRDA